MPEFESAYYLDKGGLALVLNEKGIDRFYCLDLFGTDILVEDKEACESLFSMVSEKLITIDDNSKFSLSGPVDELCKVLTQADNILSVYVKNKRLGSTVIYLTEEKATVMQSVPNRKNVLKVFEIACRDVLSFVKNNIISELKTNISTKEKDLFLESLEFLSLEDDFEQIIENEDTLFFIEYVNAKNKKSIFKIAAIGSGEELKLCIWDENGFRLESYSGELLNELLSDV